MGPHKTRREIEQELEVTRDRIEARARALRERLEPSQIAADVLDRVRSSGTRDFLDNLGRDVRDNPLPVALTGVGLAWLAGSCGARRASRFEEDQHEPGLGDRLSAKAQGAADSLRSATDSLRSGTESVRSSVESLRSDVRRRARGARRGFARGGERVRNRLSDGTERLQDGWDRVVDEQPLLIGLVGLALGAAVGALVPSTRREDQWMGEASDELKLRAAEQGRRAAEKARSAVESRSTEEHAGNGGPARSPRGPEPAEPASDTRTGIGGTFAGPNPPPSGPIRTEPTN